MYALAVEARVRPRAGCAHARHRHAHVVLTQDPKNHSRIFGSVGAAVLPHSWWCDLDVNQQRVDDIAIAVTIAIMRADVHASCVPTCTVSSSTFIFILIDVVVVNISIAVIIVILVVIIIIVVIIIVVVVAITITSPLPSPSSPSQWC